MLKFIKGDNITSEDQFKNIFNDVLRSTEKVNQFGQSIDNPNLSNDNDPTLINTEAVLVEVFDNVDQAVNLSAYNWSEYESLFDELENLGFETENHEAGNTYNWSAPLSNHINYRIFKNLETNQVFYLLEVHNGYSDVRTGYPLSFGFLFDLGYSEGNLYQLLEENESVYKYFSIGDFSFSFNIFNECGYFSVYNDILNFDNELYIGDYEDCKQWVENENKRSRILELIENFTPEQKNELGESLQDFVELYQNFENSYFSKVDNDHIENYNFFDQAKKIKDRDTKTELVNSIIKKCNWKLERHSFAPELNTLHILSKDFRIENLELRTPKARTIDEAKQYIINWHHETELKKCLSSVYCSK